MVQNFRPGVVDRMGLGWPAVHEAWVHAGTIHVGAGAAVPQTVRLPASWNR